jgi:hypothetical protein
MITIGNTDDFTVKSKSKVIINKDIEIVGLGVLPGKTEYDFSNIPEENREIFLQAITQQIYSK